MQSSNGTERAVFLDRDGVIVIPEFRNGRSYAPTTLEAFRLYPEIEGALAALKRSGFKLIVITNQPDVAAGKIDKKTLDRMHEIMTEVLPIDDVKICCHSKDMKCDCRKPQPGMLLEAAKDWNISLSTSYMIGDRASDVAAGRAAGCKTVFIDLNYVSEAKPTMQDWTVSNLQGAVDVILTRHVEKEH